MKEKLKTIPVPLLPTMVGVCTLGNVYMGLGFTAVRHLAFWLAMIVAVLYIGKFITNSDVCKNEYSNVIPASLYAGFSMMLMLIGSYIFTYAPAAGKAIWLCGVIIHAVHILIFTYRKCDKGR